MGRPKLQCHTVEALGVQTRVIPQTCCAGTGTGGPTLDLPAHPKADLQSPTRCSNWSSGSPTSTSGGATNNSTASGYALAGGGRPARSARLSASTALTRAMACPASWRWLLRHPDFWHPTGVG
jgi:hypothetical protein